MKKIKTILPVAALTMLLVSTANADEATRTILNTARLIYPSDSYLRGQYEIREKIGAELFRDIRPTPIVKSEIVSRLKAFCIKKHPYSMENRTQEMQNQLAACQFYLKGDWAEGLNDKQKNKIMNVAMLLIGDDYEMRYEWAFAEAEAFKRLSLLTVDTSAAQKKWPNSYQSQLHEALGIRPGVSMPIKSSRQRLLLEDG